MAKLSPEEIDAALSELPGWQREEEALVKEFRFKTFREAMAFVNEVADLARRLRHHPEIVINYNRVRLRLTTHDEAGITGKDTEFARQLESSELARGRPQEQ
ncbi:4a-hydroxytetrahydrobiopterin dehydratase [Thermomicrobiaceae bacterium CFH 74404]|uniref:Putative pterin-4-alpha-carbinolamine dehydratase n=1 Tax=Thermalbibacter longus TaxID=2951981 RepID=A0AA42BB70_9BACT|nr:4a-hydroxytetrahydrobiopterin dehydratase [Thermalbibacter longus]MCM8749504.1 4a-hydroxytetrahydrobiopterin dehydratase [Thermalbibacter longus]